MKASPSRIALALAALALAAPAAAVDLHGYLRAGVGGASRGGSQVCFNNQGSNYKFRLGNECETYGELQFDQTLFKNKEGVQFKYSAMLSYSTSQEQDYESLAGNSQDNILHANGNAIALRQNWVGVVLPQLKNATVWVGKRYYQRQDVHIIDFYYWDVSGFGGGIEDVDLGFGKLSLAVFQNKDFAGEGSEPRRAVWRPDVRITGVPVNPGGFLEAGVMLAYLSETSEVKTEGAQKLSPWFTVQHVQTNLFGGFNKLAVQYATGNANGMNPYPSTGNDSDVKRLRVIEHLVFQPTPTISGALVGTYQQDDDGTNVNKQWGVGARPAWHFNDFAKLAVEVGYNQVIPENGDKTSMFKATVAPTLMPTAGPAGAFFTRPELRAFATWASWNDAQKGSTGGPTFTDDTSGVTFGLQAETWF
ncbi:MAG: carbohydrate porin [Anaeromyxobacter sp.]